MKGWGSVTCSILLGLSIASGCGSRTAGFDDLYYGAGDDDDDDGGSNSGGRSSGGTTGVSGKPNAAGTGGKKPLGGSSAGGASNGGSFTAGTAPIAAAGGQPGIAGSGGAPAGGFGFGGSAGFGAVPIGGFGGVSPGCQTCLVNSCAPQFLQCLQDVGCIDIIVCAGRVGCEGLDCYRPAACKDVIDRWGGPAGPSMNELLKTFGCAVNAGCPCN